MSDTICEGCLQAFGEANGAFFRHLRSTTNPACIRYRQVRLSYRSPSPNASSDRAASPELPQEQAAPADNDRLPNSPAPQAMPFEGDYFGNYDQHDFDDFDEYDGPADDDDDGSEFYPPLSSEDEDDSSDGDNNGERSEEEDADYLEEEHSWEPPLPPHAPPQDAEATPHDASQDPSQPDRCAPGVRQQVEERLRTRTHIVAYPHPDAGARVSARTGATSNERYATEMEDDSNIYSPFISELDWQFARWAKMRGPGSTAVTELLQIPHVSRLFLGQLADTEPSQLATRLGLSYQTSQQLNAIIDKHLNSGRPRFTRREIRINREVFEIYYRDIIECVRALFGDPEFAGVLVFAPERHYADEDHTVRVYFDMHTGKWWWNTQRALDEIRPGATVIPVIIASDKTQLTLFGSKTAYPVYLTIGNLPKDIRRKPSRRGQILLAYLPSTRLEHVSGTASRRRMLANLYHACLTRVLKPLRRVGVDGLSLASGDGVLRRGHPIFVLHVGDYLEQILATGTKQGECPKCPIPRDAIGEYSEHPSELRNLGNVLDALATLDDPNVSYREYAQACKDAGIKPIVRPYWADLPFVNIYQSIVPDLLHQLYQGVIKHLLGWLRKAFGSDEIDARCRRIPPNHNIRLFLKGITKLQRVTGKEHGQMCRFLLGLIIGLPLPGGMSPARLLRAVRALLDFLYLAQYPAHTSESLELLKDALRRFHANKAIFVDLGIRLHFKLPKLHSLEHYILSILLFGTTDNYDTQYTERLHIDFAKDAYRASNHKDELPQMTTWLERREKILRHEIFIQWRLAQQDSRDESDAESTQQAYRPDARRQQVALPPILQKGLQLPLTRIKITRHPSVKALTFERAVHTYGAGQLHDALARFIVQYNDPHLAPAEVRHRAALVYMRFRSFPAFHRLKFILEDAQALGVMEDTHDTAHARPQRTDLRGRLVPGRFDTVLVNEHGTAGGLGLDGYRVGRLRLIFKIPRQASDHLFPDLIHPGHLAVTRPRGRPGEKPPSVIEPLRIGLVAPS
ncbi:hypothetical protein ONZ51_g12036 [Trametes cubensis]|uniref:Uncharacterized protein n=1 Tax=Trametes cubensis TaxID=1111947 RepID=A0AAD7TGI1_9APHY|nr:hypothetical protein ONZ51_g12036 [Trametes cubensis]